MGELLAADAAGELRGRGVEIVHYAFGLTVPFRIPETTR